MPRQILKRDSQTHLIDRDAVLALLKDGPMDTGPIGAALGQPTPRIYAALMFMRRDKLVKKVGVARRWALASYVSRVGTLARDREPIKDAMLLALARGPMTQKALKDTCIAHSWKMIETLCGQMRQDGTLLLFGYGPNALWALPGTSDPHHHIVLRAPAVRRSTTKPSKYRPKSYLAKESLSWWCHPEGFYSNAAQRNLEMLRDKEWKKQWINGFS